MIADLKPYPAMKDSGMRWLGEVPEHWEVGTLRRRLKTYDGIKIGPFGSQLKLEYMTGSGYKVYGQANVIASDFARGTKFVDDEKYRELSAYEVRPGDILLTMMGSSGRCALVPEGTSTGIMDSHLLRLRPHTSSVDGRFGALVIDQAPYVKEQVAVAGKGSIMHGLNSSMVKNLVLAFPPLPEQSAIVRFLDHAGRRIRRAIRAKQKLIALLTEQKQSIIHRAVTRGLDPNVGLKPSGVRWLGEVPEHWQIRPAKRYLREVDERSATGTETLLSVSHITGITPRSEKNITMFMAGSYVGHKLCRDGDLVINTMWAWAGALGVSQHAGLVSPSYAVYRPAGDSHLPPYLDLLLRTEPYVDEFASRSTGIRRSRLRLYPDQFLRIPLICPPLAEQRAILVDVAISTGQLDSALRSAHWQIEVLREYRVRLVADVVMGKLDVRNVAAGLPDERDEPAPLDTFEELTNGDESAQDADFQALSEERDA